MILSGIQVNTTAQGVFVAGRTEDGVGGKVVTATEILASMQEHAAQIQELQKRKSWRPKDPKTIEELK